LDHARAGILEWRSTARIVVVAWHSVEGTTVRRIPTPAPWRDLARAELAELEVAAV
jgi:hypothetical protein